jgi:restriction endonuclease Mrr
MNKTALSAALSMINQFEAASHLIGQEAERLVISILDCCGYAVTERGFAENQDGGVDCYFFAPIDGKPQRIGVDIRSWTRKIDARTVQKALDIAAGAQFDRSWIIARSGFTAQAQQLADSYGPGKLDLLTSSDLRNWVAKQSDVTGQEPQDVAIIRRAMQELACEIARDPGSLYRREWRDLERILREVFEHMGFRTHLTRPGKDGGFDLELSTRDIRKPKTYLVEVKHWLEKRPGAAVLKKLVKVSIERKVEGAVLLSTSGFTRTINSGLLEATAPPIRLGDSSKMVALCKTFYRLKTGYWLEEALPDSLFAGTILAEPLPIRPQR